VITLVGLLNKNKKMAKIANPTIMPFLIISECFVLLSNNT